MLERRLAEDWALRDSGGLWRYARAGVLVGAPLGLIPLELTHPGVGPSPFQSVAPVADWWITLHVMLLALFGLFALAVYLLIAGDRGLVARWAALLIGVFAVANSAFVAVDGIGVGLLARYGRSLPVDQQLTVDAAVQALWVSPAVNALAALADTAWVLSLAGAAVVLCPLGDLHWTWPVLGVGVGLRLLAAVLMSVPTVGMPIADSIDWLLLFSVGCGVLVAALVVVRRRRLQRALILALLIIAAFLPQHGALLGAAGVCSFLLAVGVVLVSESRASREPGPEAANRLDRLDSVHRST
jgi:hypothetical protein